MNKITITIENESGKHEVIVPCNTKIADALNRKYPEMTMMTAMEECNELAMAMSKCVRNGSADKKANLAEEIVDVLICIQWAIRRFGITPGMLQEWANTKTKRAIERQTSDEIIFRSSEAKESYSNHTITPTNSAIQIRRGKNSNYEVTGDTQNLAEYYHVLHTFMANHGISPDDIDYNIPKTAHKEDKSSKKTAKELNKILERASKNTKNVDKCKKGKKGKK